MAAGQMVVEKDEITLMLKRLSSKELRKAELSTLRKSANILARETTKRFKENINIDNRRVSTINKKGKTVTKIRRIATVKVHRREMAAKVNILSDFRLKFFEMGTKERHTKGRKIVGEHIKKGRKYLLRKGKGRRTGRIKAGWYFRSAQQDTERQIFDNMDNLLSKEIVRIANKK